MSDPSPQPSLAGRSLAGYDVVEKLGAGGMGVVYRAVDRKLGRNVALKLLPETRGEDTAAKERFLREARAASALDHPNIGTIYGVEELPEGGLCIVMAFYEGKTLAERMARRRLSLSETIRIAIQIADGLAAAHAAGIIHRDVKPSNVMLTSSDLVKVVDFGLAKLIAGGDESLTEPAKVVGTVSYMSPEQARGQLLDGRTDIWSLGVMIYECASGTLPFHGPDHFALLYSVVHDAPPPLESVYPDLEAATRKALEKDPQRRFRSMQEFADELRRISRALELSNALETQVMGTVSASAVSAVGVSRLPRARTVIVAGIAAIVMALAAAALSPQLRERVFSSGIRTVATDKDIVAANHTTLAVLPFSGGDAETSALAAGLSQRLGARLVALEPLRDSLTILPPSDLLARAVSGADQAVRKLGATMVVSGTLSRTAAGQTLSLEIRDRRRAQPQRVVVENADIGILEDRAVNAIAGTLELQASPQVSAALWRTGTSVAAAYEPYLRGMGYLQRWDKAENLAQARAEFHRAAAADPGFALAQAGLAATARIAYKSNQDPSDLQAAIRYAQDAIRLDPKLAEAHVALGNVYLTMNQQRDLAVVEFQRALELEPRSSDAIRGMASAYVQMGRDAEAEAAFKQGVRLRPWSWIAYNELASYYFRKNLFADAEAQYRKALEVAPDSAAVFSNLGVTLMAEEKFPEAVTMFRKSIELEPEYPAWNNLASLYYRQHSFRQAADAYGKALELNDRDFRVWGSRGQALLHSGSPRTEAENALHRAIALGEQQMQVHPDDVDSMSLLALYQAFSGDNKAAIARVNEAMTRSAITGEAAANVAEVYQLTGDGTAAARWAQTALDTGYSWSDLKTDVEMEPLVSSGSLRHSR